MHASLDRSAFAAARQAMIDCQLRPVGVVDRRVLAAMARVPRERFVPPEQWPLAYADIVVPLGDGRALSPPVVTGRLLSELAPEPGERALVVGAGGGYSAAVLAEIGLAVTALDCQAAEVPGVEFVAGSLAAGWPAGAPYDLILIDSAIGQLPEAILAQLAEGGRIGLVLKQRGVDRLAIGRRAGGGFGLRAFADADAAELPGFEQPVTFTF